MQHHITQQQTKHMKTSHLAAFFAIYMMCPLFAKGQHLVKSFGSQTSIENITAADSTVYFTASFNGLGRELWKSDGTEAGTVMVHDINPGPADSNPTYLNFHNKILYFSATDGGGYGLWKTDGTSAGTVKISSAYGLSLFYPCGSTLYFVADDGIHGMELWKTDGTQAGTVMVKDINVGSGAGIVGFSPSCLNGVLAFAATDTFVFSTALWNIELWKSDGTEAGTTLVADLNNDNSSGSDPLVFGSFWLTTFNNEVYFAAHGKLWKSDLNNNTVLVKDFSGSSPFSITQMGNSLFFATHGGLWKTDGTSAGTIVLTSGIGGELRNVLRNYNGNLLFSTSMGMVNTAVWKSDGTAGGTVLVKTLDNDANYTVFNGLAYFTGSRGFLYRTNGTSAGTVVVKNLDPCYVGQLTVTGNGSKMFFATYSSTNCPAELWVMHKTSNPTGITEAGEPKVRIYPNPATNQVQIELDAPQATFTLYNLQGKKVFSQHLVQNLSTIDIDHLPSGIYVYTIGSESELRQGKLAVE